MTTLFDPTSLEELPRRELQALAKEYGVKANSKSATIILSLQALFPESQPSPEKHIDSSCENEISKNKSSSDLKADAESLQESTDGRSSPTSSDSNTEVEVTKASDTPVPDFESCASKDEPNNSPMSKPKVNEIQKNDKNLDAEPEDSTSKDEPNKSPLSESNVNEIQENRDAEYEDSIAEEVFQSTDIVRVGHEDHDEPNSPSDIVAEADSEPTHGEQPQSDCVHISRTKLDAGNDIAQAEKDARIVPLHAVKASASQDVYDVLHDTDTRSTIDSITQEPLTPGDRFATPDTVCNACANIAVSEAVQGINTPQTAEVELSGCVGDANRAGVDENVVAKSVMDMINARLAARGVTSTLSQTLTKPASDAKGSTKGYEPKPTNMLMSGIPRIAAPAPKNKFERIFQRNRQREKSFAEVDAAKAARQRRMFGKKSPVSARLYQPPKTSRLSPKKSHAVKKQQKKPRSGGHGAAKPDSIRRSTTPYVSTMMKGAGEVLAEKKKLSRTPKNIMARRVTPSAGGKSSASQKFSLKASLAKGNKPWQQAKEARVRVPLSSVNNDHHSVAVATKRIATVQTHSAAQPNLATVA